MPTKKLTLSVIIPVYNEQYHLKQCLETIASQTRTPDEIIIVDNNSTDQTVFIAKQFPGVRVVNEKTQGVLFASRTGFDAVNNDIICRIDADTIMAPDWLEQVSAYFAENPNIAAVTGNCYFYDFPLRKIIRVLHHAVYYRVQKMIAGTEVLWGSNMAIRTNAWKMVRADCISHPGIHEDIDLSFHMQNQHLLIKRSSKLIVGVSMLRGNLNPIKLLRYLWPWPSNSMASYFWSWPRTYWVNKRYVQSLKITILMLLTGLSLLPVSMVLWPIVFIKKHSQTESI